jgi:dipeptidase D
LTRFVAEEARRLGLRLAAIDGGSKHNAIPRESEATVFVHPAAEPDLKAAVIRYDEALKEEWGRAEPSVFVQTEEGPAVMPQGVLSPADQDRVLDLLAALPHGVIAMSEAVEGLVQTSTNLAVVVTEAQGVRVLTSQRSSGESELEAICSRVAELGRRTGARIDQGPGYPPWPPDPTSPLLSRACQVFRRVFDAEPDIKAVHAGLECGIIGAKFADMDMISFGPTILGAHSPSERVHIPSVADFWTFLTAMLEAPPA